MCSKLRVCFFGCRLLVCEKTFRLIFLCDICVFRKKLLFEYSEFSSYGTSVSSQCQFSVLCFSVPQVFVYFAIFLHFW